MNDYGIKVSQVGESADGPDSRLVFSSSWKLLNIIKEVSYTNLAAGSTLYTHGLGYTPLFIPYSNQRFQTNGLGHTPGVASFNHTFGVRTYANNSKVFLAQNGLSSLASGRVIVTPINIEENYTAPIVKTDSASKNDIVDRDYGIKVVLEGKNINSQDSRDFAIHSGYRTPMIHMIKTFVLPGGSNTFIAEHNLGYPPMFLVYGNIDSSPGWQVLGSAGDVFVYTTSTEVSVTLGYQGKLSIVVLKDPLEIT